MVFKSIQIMLKLNIIPKKLWTILLILKFKFFLEDLGVVNEKQKYGRT